MEIGSSMFLNLIDSLGDVDGHEVEIGHAVAGPAAVVWGTDQDAARADEVGPRLWAELWAGRWV